MHNGQRFLGKKVVVTGAAAGIGAACAARFTAEGAEVLLIDRAAEVSEVADRLRAAALQIDLAATDAGPLIAAEVSARWGSVDILINNAGIGGSKRLVESDDALLDRIVEVNLMAVVRLTRDLTPLLAAPGGRIVNVSSAFGLVGYPGTTAYSIAKAGVAQLTRQQAGELGPRGITVNAIAPGVVETAMTRQKLLDPVYQRLQVDPIPLGRVGLPEEQAAVVAFLASEEASYVNGAVLPVDGGYLAARHQPSAV